MSKTIRSIYPNKGVELAYKKRLQSMIYDMQRSVVYWVTSAYRNNTPRVAQLAEDATPSEKMNKVLNELGKRWIDTFEKWAPKIAEVYVTDLWKATDSAFRQALKSAGWTVEFKVTPAVRDALNASVIENVNLIKSIPTTYFDQVNGIVMRSYTAGRDLATMTKELNALYPKAKDRAELIARDQSNKLNATVNRTRRMELGITEAIWMHSGGGKEPRQSHVAANGKKFNVEKGALIDGEWIQPGEKINCRCTSRAVLPI